MPMLKNFKRGSKLTKGQKVARKKRLRRAQRPG
jgi:hypothetical protein